MNLGWVIVLIFLILLGVSFSGCVGLCTAKCDFDKFFCHENAAGEVYCTSYPCYHGSCRQAYGECRLGCEVDAYK